MSRYKELSKGHLECVFFHASAQAHPRALLDETSVVLTEDQLNLAGQELIDRTAEEEKIPPEIAAARIIERVSVMGSFLSIMNMNKPKDAERLLIEEGVFQALPTGK